MAIKIITPEKRKSQSLEQNAVTVIVNLNSTKKMHPLVKIEMVNI